MKQAIIILLFSLKLMSSPIVLNTLPKSGSIYIWNSLCQGLNKQAIQISDANFPVSRIFPNKIISLSCMQGVTQCHFDPSSENIQLLKRFAPKVVVHLRDPRQSMLSWVHHMNKEQKNKATLDRFLVPLPNDYFTWDLKTQIDWNIENYLVHCVEWIKNWIQCSIYNQEVEVLFTTYEEFMSDRDQFFSQILSFYGYNSNQPIPKLVEAEGQYHYRNGTVDEWREVLTLEQQMKATELIPKDFFIRFNWVP